MVFPIAGGNESKGYEISNSLRFNDDDSPNLTVAQSTPTDGSRWTWSGWVKRGNLSDGSNAETFASSYNGSNTDRIQFTEDDELHVEFKNGSSTVLELHTTQLFRDPSAWYHIVVAFDSNLSQSNRVKIYVNGTQVTSFSTSTELSTSGYTTKGFNANSKNFVHGAYESSSLSSYYDGYLTEINFVDGAGKAQTDFGEFDDNGVWIPKKYTGTYGTNGFFLQFKQTGTSQNSSGIGADTSGQDNHFAVSNLAATDVTTDTCTNNFATLNSIWRNASAHSNTYSEGNLKINLNSSGGNTYSTIAVSQGKWYFEFETLSNFQCQFEGRTTNNFADYSAGAGNTTFTWYYSGNIKVNNSDSGVSQAYGHQSNNTNETKEICGVAVDLDNNKVYFHRQGTYVNSGNPSTGSNGITITNAEYMFGFSNDSGTTRNVANFNFGNPAFAISSGNTDGKYGNFEYAVPSGYYALCTKRLAEFG